jgi:hypothetical protein
MYIGIARLDYHLPLCHSLKEKRQILRRLIERVRAQFKVSVNEVDHQDLWQRTAIGAAVVGSDHAHVERMTVQIADFMERQHLAEPLGRRLEVIPFGRDDEEPLGDAPAPWEEDEP